MNNAQATVFIAKYNALLHKADRDITLADVDIVKEFAEVYNDLNDSVKSIIDIAASSNVGEHVEALLRWVNWLENGVSPV